MLPLGNGSPAERACPARGVLWRLQLTSYALRWKAGDRVSIVPIPDTLFHSGFKVSVQRTKKTVAPRIVAAHVLGLVIGSVVACSLGESGRESAQVRDSAGIRISDLPPTSAQTRRIHVEVDDGPIGPPDLEYGRIAALGIGRDGIVAVLDQLEAKVVVLTNSGAVRSQFGNPGGGPGELDPRGLAGVVIDGQSVLVPDVVSQRLTRFDLDGGVVEIVPLPAKGGLTADWTPHPAGGYVYRVVNPSGDRLVWAGAVTTDTIHRLRAPVDPPNTLMAAKPLWAFTADGELWVGYSHVLEVARFAPGDARPIVIARRDEGAAEVTEAELEHLRALLEESLLRRAGGTLSPEMREQMLAIVRLPTVRPRVAQLLTGPSGTVWLNRVGRIESMGEEVLRVAGAEGLGSNEWEVLDSAGNPLGVAALPREFSAMVIVDSLIYGVQTDGFGVETVQRLRMRLE